MKEPGRFSDDETCPVCDRVEPVRVFPRPNGTSHRDPDCRPQIGSERSVAEPEHLPPRSPRRAARSLRDFRAGHGRATWRDRAQVGFGHGDGPRKTGVVNCRPHPATIYTNAVRFPGFRRQPALWGSECIDCTENEENRGDSASASPRKCTSGRVQAALNARIAGVDTATAGVDDSLAKLMFKSPGVEGGYFPGLKFPTPAADSDQ